MKQTSLPTVTVTVKQTSLPTVTVKQTSLPTVTVKQTSLPTVTMKQTSLPTVTMKQTSLPTVTMKQTSLPTVTVKQTSLPTVTVKQTSLPTVTMKQTSLPTVTVTSLPTVTVKQTSLPTVTVKQTSLPTVTMKQTSLPTVTVKQTSLPTSETDFLTHCYSETDFLTHCYSETDFLTHCYSETDFLTHCYSETDFLTHCYSETDFLTHCLKQTSLPTVTVKQTSLPTVTVKQTSLPTVTVKQTSLPTVTVKQTSLPTVTVKQTSLPTVTVKQTSSPTVPQVIPQQTLPNPFPSIVTPKPSAVVIAEVFPSVPIKKLPTINCQIPPPHVIDEVFPQAVCGFSDGETDDDEQSTDEAMEGENEEDDIDSIGDIKPKSEDMEMEIEEFTLPDTIEGVRDRFNKLYVEFMRHTHEHTNELMFFLDEMLRQGAITPTEYAQLNTSLTEAADLRTDGAEKEEDSDDEEQNLMKPVGDYIIRDKEELLMEELKDDIDEEFVNIVLDREKLLEIFFAEEFLVGEPIRSQIDELLNKLETSEIPKSNQHRIKMLFDDITKNRYRIEQIIQKLLDAEDKEEMSTILQMLVREGLLSDKQFKQLGELEDPDLERITEVIMDTKIG